VDYEEKRSDLMPTYSPVEIPPISDLWYGTSGPHDARIAVVAESWGSTEAYSKLPLVGESGKEFDRMLSAAGIRREDCFVTNCFAAQPPRNEVGRFFNHTRFGGLEWRGLNPTKGAQHELDRLFRQLKAVKPTLVIALGNFALWALTEGLVSYSNYPTEEERVVVRAPTGVSSWRGSMLQAVVPGLSPAEQPLLLPILHPAAILRAWYERDTCIHDLSVRVPLALSGDWRPNPPPNIVALPTFADADRVLGNWLIRAAAGDVLRLSHDIETARGVITCMAFADGPYRSGSTSLVIPFVRPNGVGPFESYWTAHEEIQLTRTLIQLWSHPNVRIEGQNYNYDTQWIEAFYGSRPNLDFDTMLAHHLLWPGTPKALDYLASLYNHYYWYWKDDNKEWDVKGNFEQHLRYNAEDALRTFECATELRLQLKQQGFGDLWEIEKEKNLLALEMMRRGVRIDRERRAEMGFQLAFELGKVNKWLGSIIPQRWLLESEWAPKSSKKNWWESSTQQKDVFFRILGFPSKKSRKTGNETLDAEALEKLRHDVPWAARIWDAIEQARSIGVFKNTFVDAALEPNGRMKCSFNTAGTETFRWSSSTNAFWRGTNLQNIPKGEEKDD
jgi:uracil-DNA glycosylase